MAVVDTHALPANAPKAGAGVRRSYIDEVADAAANIRFARVAVAILTFPFLAVGFVVGVVWMMIRFALVAVRVGFRRARDIRTSSGEVT
jgi:nitrate reductase NapE component